MYPPPLHAALLLLLMASSTAPNPEKIQPLHLPPSPPATIPAFREHSAATSCPLDLSDNIFDALHSACGGELHRSRCCPVLAAWLYSAYSSTALGLRAGARVFSGHASPPYYMPLLPADTETCVDGLGRALRERGMRLSQPNETCDVVYCYCGIRLHPLTCPEAFVVGSDGKLRGNENVKRLETDCFNGGNSRHGFPGLNGCSKCLNSLHMLTQNSSDNSSKSGDRTTKMRNKDCHLMGLTWLLSKDRTAYIHTVTSVLRAIMLSSNGSDLQSCALGSDGLPLAVDSSEISGSSSHFSLQSSSINLLVLLLLVLYCRLVVVP